MSEGRARELGVGLEFGRESAGPADFPDADRVDPWDSAYYSEKVKASPLAVAVCASSANSPSPRWLW